jgi:hypothetical protein
MEVQVIIALAGRRIDAPERTQPVFPEANIDAVRGKLLSLFREQHVSHLISSAACGADLLALDAAGSMGICRRIILPFAPTLFRETSVIDRPGDWGALFDRIISEVEAENNVIDLQLELDSATYVHTSYVILSEAASLAETMHLQSAALLVWDGISRGEDDMTSILGEAARVSGLQVLQISTL